MSNSMPNPVRPVIVLFVISLVVATVGMLLPRDALPTEPTFNDKLQHLLAYAWLVALGGWLRPDWTYRLLTAAALAGHGGAIELTQLLVPGRSAEWLDWGADNTGIIVGLCLLALADEIGKRLGTAHWPRRRRLTVP
jgi:VanZ family protein